MEKFAKEKLSQESYQIFFGILLGVITGICLFLPNFFADEIYSWLFLIPFAVVMFGKNIIYNKYGVTVRKLMIVYAISFACVLVILVVLIVLQLNGIIGTFFTYLD